VEWVLLANNQLPLQLCRQVEEDSVEGALFVQQLQTEKQMSKVASAQNECARATVSRQFK
jgi:bacterioferritin-associated ferredoxin